MDKRGTKNEFKKSDDFGIAQLLNCIENPNRRMFEINSRIK